MAVREVREMGDPILNKTCKEVKEMTPRTRDLIEDMLDTMYEANAFAWSGIYSGVRYDEAYYLPQAGINVLGNIRFEF